MSYINRSYLKDTIKNFYDVVLVPLFNKKIDINQGTSKAGKSLVVGEDGNVTTGDVISGVQIDDTTASDTTVYSSNKIVNTYVAKEIGKDLSSNDYTSAEKTKLEGIAENAEVNVQANWNETDPSSDAYINNKPTIPDELADLSDDSTHRLVTDTEKTTWDNKYVKPTGGIPASDLEQGVIPTSLPASNVTNTYSATGTAPVSGKAVASAISNLATKSTTLAGYGITDAVKSSEKGAASGIATLGTDGKIPSSQLPSYVDDVLEYAGKSKFPTTGETGKIYIDTATNITYRWSGSAYTAIGSDLALGETSSTAYAGDKGKAVTDALATHKADTTSHITSSERTAWNAKSNLTIGTTSTTAAAGNHTHSSYVNQNAFSNVVVGSTTIAADSATDSLTLVAGSNVTITPDATNDKVTIAATNTTYGVATQSANGLMSAADKTKLDNVATSTDGTITSKGDVLATTEDGTTVSLIALSKSMVSIDSGELIDITTS